MHAVNGHKLFRYRVRHPEVIFGGPWNAADDLAFTDASEVLVDPFPGQAPPVAMHSNLQGRVRDDRGCPVDSVDLRDERCVDQPGMIEQFIVGPGWIGGAELVTNDVVFHSRVNKVCSILKPIHQLPLTPVISTPVAGSSGSRPSAPIASLPPSPDRTFASVAASLPYSWEPSHQCVAVLRYVGGKSSEPGVRVGSLCVRRMRMGCSGQGSSSLSGISQGFSFWFFP